MLEQLKAGTRLFLLCMPSVAVIVTVGVESLFNKANCDSTAITELLGGYAGVTDNNILQYMGIIEQRCNELLRLQSFIQAKVMMIYDWIKQKLASTTQNGKAHFLPPLNPCACHCQQFKCPCLHRQSHLAGNHHTTSL